MKSQEELNLIINHHISTIDGLLSKLESIKDRAECAEISLQLAKEAAKLTNDFYATKDESGLYKLTTKFVVVDKNAEEKKKEEEKENERKNAIQRIVLFRKKK